MRSGLGIALFVVTLFVMVMVHETGHFLAARAFRIKVEEFFVGFGPRIFSWRRGETEYGLKAILLGGYVRIAGMNPYQTIPPEEVPRTFGAKPAWQRAIVLVAGSATHFVMGVLVMTIVYAVTGFPFEVSTTIDAISDASPAEVAGLEAGDEVLEVDGKAIGKWEDFRSIVRKSAGKEIEIVVERNGRERTIRATPETQPDPETGDKVGMLGLTPEPKKERFPQAVVSGVRYTGFLTVESVKNIGKVFSPSGVKEVFEALRGKGPRTGESAIGLVGMGRYAGQFTSEGQFAILLVFFASFIVFVGVINLVPLPPLDGGHLAVLAIEKIRGRPVDMKKIVPVAAVVIVFLLLFTLALFYLDIARPVTVPF